MVFWDGGVGVRNRVSWRHSVSGFGVGLAVGVRYSLVWETPGVHSIVGWGGGSEENGIKKGPALCRPFNSLGCVIGQTPRVRTESNLVHLG
jgi:hypothetical protein